MYCYPPWQPDATRILTYRELATILEHLSAKVTRSRSAALDLAIFRLSRFRQSQFSVPEV